jgi:hypothetical protein
VNYARVEEASAAIAGLNGYSLNGKVLQVSFKAPPKK